MQIRYRSAVIVVLVGLALASANFWTIASSASERATSAGNAESLTTVSFGTVAVQASSDPLYVGLLEGIFAKHGLNLTITYGHSEFDIYRYDDRRC